MRALRSTLHPTRRLVVGVRRKAPRSVRADAEPVGIDLPRSVADVRTRSRGRALLRSRWLTLSLSS